MLDSTLNFDFGYYFSVNYYILDGSELKLLFNRYSLVVSYYNKFKWREHLLSVSGSFNAIDLQEKQEEFKEFNDESLLIVLGVAISDYFRMYLNVIFIYLTLIFLFKIFN